MEFAYYLLCFVSREHNMMHKKRLYYSLFLSSTLLRPSQTLLRPSVSHAFQIFAKKLEFAKKNWNLYLETSSYYLLGPTPHIPDLFCDFFLIEIDPQRLDRSSESRSEFHIEFQKNENWIFIFLEWLRHQLLRALFLSK